MKPLTIKSVEVRFEGPMDLSKLGVLGYKEKSPGTWEFLGRMHRYSFERVDGTKVDLTITARKASVPLIPEITFSQIRDWVGKSVEACGGNRVKEASAK